MSDVNKDIGMRIKELRELSDITTEEIAKELDVDEETYISYEEGIIDIPASFLYLLLIEGKNISMKTYARNLFIKKLKCLL